MHTEIPGAKFRTLGPVASISLLVMDSSRLFAQREHSTRCAPIVMVAKAPRMYVWVALTYPCKRRVIVLTIWRRLYVKGALTLPLCKGDSDLASLASEGNHSNRMEMDSCVVVQCKFRTILTGGKMPLGVTRPKQPAHRNLTAVRLGGGVRSANRK